jgi:hypothetical protein
MTSRMHSRHTLDREARLMLQAALLIFVWTIAIGILNGLDLVEFTRTQLLSHLHGGTLGWLTLGILSLTIWLFGGDDVSDRSRRFIRAWSALAVVAVAAYVLAFATTMGIMRPLAGTLTLTALVGFAGWALSRVPHVTPTVPRLFALVGLATSVLGGMFGVINGLAIARGWSIPSSFFDAHPGTMEIGFVLPVAMGLAEWGLRRGMPEERASRAGLVQVAVMFVAFALALTFFLAEMEEQVGLATMLAVVGVVIFWVRMWSIARHTSLLRRWPQRHALVGGVLIGVTLVYITVLITRAEGVFEDIPRGQQLGFIHLMAVGATTNTLLAYVTALSQRTTAPNLLDDVIFWGVNVGVIGFVTVLTIDARDGIYVFVPIMGAALLVAIATHVARLRRDVAESVSEEAVRLPTTQPA